MSRGLRFAVAALGRGGVLIVALAGCGLPRDADGTLDRVRGHALRVGFAVDTPWTTDSAGGAGGVESALVRRLAQDIGTHVEWVHGQQGDLLEALRQRDLDLVIGGLRGKSPWSTQVGFTRPYYTDTVVVGGAPSAAPPASIAHAQIAVLPGDAAASAIRAKHGTPVVVRALASSNLPVAAPTWRLAQLGRRPNVDLVLMQTPHVLAAPPGENAWLVRIEQILIAEQDSVPGLLRGVAR